LIRAFSSYQDRLQLCVAELTPQPSPARQQSGFGDDRTEVTLVQQLQQARL
jgi:hypothetical protein